MTLEELLSVRSFADLRALFARADVDPLWLVILLIVLVFLWFAMTNVVKIDRKFHKPGEHMMGNIRFGLNRMVNQPKIRTRKEAPEAYRDRALPKRYRRDRPGDWLPDDDTPHKKD